MAALAYYEPEEERKAKVYQYLKDVVIPSKLGFIEAKLKSNGGKHLVGDQYTWADLTAAHVFKAMNDYAGPVSGELATAFPALTALANDVEQIPQIAAYIAKRPETDH